MPYICRLADHEDLSTQVANEVAAKAPLVALANATAPLEWRVVVTCSQGHANAFSGRGVADPPNVDVMGQPPNDLDDLLVKAAAHLSPVESLSRLDAAAKFFIGLVSTIGMLGTALGLLAAPASPPVWLVSIPALLAALSIASALMAVTPKVDHVPVTNLTAMLAHFEQLISARARWVRISGVFLALSLLSLPIVRALAEPAPPPPAVARITLTSRALDESRAISFGVKIVGVAPAETINLEVRGFTDENAVWEEGDVIAASSAQADEKGTLDVTLEAQRPAAEPYREFRAQADAKSKGMQQARIRVPQSPPNAH